MGFRVFRVFRVLGFRVSGFWGFGVSGFRVWDFIRFGGSELCRARGAGDPETCKP